MDYQVMQAKYRTASFLIKENSMAFVNEFVPIEDIHKYGLKQQWDKYHRYHPYDIENPFSPLTWTVDRERDVFFMQARSGKEEFSAEVECIFWWRGEYLGVLIIAVDGAASIPEDKGFKTWKLGAIRKPDNSTASDEDIIPVLKEALTAYGCRGIYRQLSDYPVNFTF